MRHDVIIIRRIFYFNDLQLNGKFKIISTLKWSSKLILGDEVILVVTFFNIHTAFICKLNTIYNSSKEKKNNNYIAKLHFFLFYLTYCVILKCVINNISFISYTRRSKLKCGFIFILCLRKQRAIKSTVYYFCNAKFDIVLFYLNQTN